MSVFLTSIGVTCAVGALVIALWDHIREEEYRKWTKSSDLENWDYRRPKTPSEYVKNNVRRRMRKDQIGDVITQRLFLFSLMFFLATLGVAGWLS